MGGTAEEMFFFGGLRGRKLLGFLHAVPPERNARAGKAEENAALGLVYCHPLAEERNQSQGVAVRTARLLASRGIPVLRFDFSGCGDSEGLLEEASAEDWIAEIGLALDVLREKTGVARTGVWGLRAGANLAARYADGRDDVALGIFWQPLPDLKMMMTQFLRQKLSTEMAGAAGAAGAAGVAGEGMPGSAAGQSGGLSVKALVQRLEAGDTVEVMGYPVTRRLYESMLAAGAPFSGSRFAFPACVTAINEADAPPEGLKRMAETLSGGPPAELLHVREAPFWDRYWRWDAPLLSQETARWAARAM
jgi:alpha-beta hydrolase superfamily lysophospholipase